MTSAVAYDDFAHLAAKQPDSYMTDSVLDRQISEWITDEQDTDIDPISIESRVSIDRDRTFTLGNEKYLIHYSNEVSHCNPFLFGNRSQTRPG